MDAGTVCSSAYSIVYQSCQHRGEHLTVWHRETSSSDSGGGCLPIPIPIPKSLLSKKSAGGTGGRLELVIGNAALFLVCPICACYG